jgi:hypothetical protein
MLLCAVASRRCRKDAPATLLGHPELRLVSPVSCLLSPVSCLLSPVSCFLDLSRVELLSGSALIQATAESSFSSKAGGLPA